MKISPETREKQTRLERYILSLGSAAVAFSAGVDSTFLLHAAHRLLGGNVIAVTVSSVAVPESELDEAKVFCEKEGIEHIIVHADLLSLENFRNNPPDRCYHCKKYLFSNVIAIAAERGIYNILEGSNTDDLGDYRPGMAAVRELGILSPLLEAGLDKAEIRALSEEAGLPTFSKPPLACLASRIAHGEAITAEKLAAVDKGEQILRGMGFSQYRVRCHASASGNIARIEVPREEFSMLASPVIRAEVNDRFRGLGFAFVTLDLGGYRTGSMNSSE